MRDLVLQNCRLDNRYDIRERLGRGSYAEIFLADDIIAAPHSVHKKVVIKALNVFLQNDLDQDLEKTLVENFQNEAIALDRVRHPNVLNRLGHGTAKDMNGTAFHYLVLEYLPGGDLSGYCRDRRLSLAEALGFIEQVCAGLAHAHKNDIIHRDIKPQNLLLSADHKIVKIADFGVARSTSSINPITRVGTNIYAPPEHSPLMAGKTANLEYSVLTPAADIYSLAKTAYVLFTGETPRHLANCPVTEMPVAVRSEPWSIPLKVVLNRATLDDPRTRYQDVVEFWKSLSGLSQYLKNDTRFVTASLAHETSVMPKAHVSKGYTPLAPVKPAFDTARNLKIKEAAPTTSLKPLEFKPRPQPRLPDSDVRPLPPLIDLPKPGFGPDTPSSTLVPVPQKKRRLFRAGLAFLIFLVIFAGSLFATYNFLRGRNIFSGFAMSDKRTGYASTDINLRPAPATDNLPVGLVTKGSTVQILQTSNNWHEVVIIRHGRTVNAPITTNRGWVYGRYIVEEE